MNKCIFKRKLICSLTAMMLLFGLSACGYQESYAADIQAEPDLGVSEEKTAQTDINTEVVSAIVQEEYYVKPGEKPGDKPGAKTVAKSSEKSGKKSGEKPGDNTKTNNADVSGNSSVSGPVVAGESRTDSAYDLTALYNMQYTDEQMAQINAFYNGAVFAGDSVMLGFRNYATRSSDEMLKGLRFLASGSYSLHNAFWPVSSKSVHPLYQGAQYPLWESIQMMGANRVFLFFGINDVAQGMDDSIALYGELVDKIHELTPNADITVISATYTLKGTGTKGLNNDNLAAFNQAISKMASENGWGYIDMANVLSDGEGNLASKYCSDGFLHENNAAYEVWKLMLISYAAERLGYETPKIN